MVLYYIDEINGNDTNTGSETNPWKTITKANQTLIAGDTVYIKGGIYSNQYIAPNNSGTALNRIIYQNFGIDIVTVQDATRGVWLNNKSYITVQGINFYNLDNFLQIENNSNYNIIAYCNFDQMRNPSEWDGSRIWKLSNYNWVHHCQFSKYGICTGTPPSGDDQYGVFEIGYDAGGASYCAQYNLIEDNIMFHGGHHVFGVHCRYNTIRNNYFHNEGWLYNNTRGNRNIYFSGVQSTCGYNLIEGNRIGYAEKPCDSYGVGGAAIASHHNIIRYNSFYHNNLYGLSLYAYSVSYVDYNKIYNNTFFHNAYNPDPYFKSDYICAIFMQNASNEIKYNVFKNNLYYKHYQPYGYQDTTSPNDQVFANNWNGDIQGDPTFTNATTTLPADKTDKSLPNLKLQLSSPCINTANNLTTVSASDIGHGNVLIVNDAGYFQDGTWSPPNTSQPDWIAVGTINNIVQISSIGYSNTIYLVNSINRNINDPIWLYKKSDGKIVIYNSVDVGSEPYTESTECPQIIVNFQLT